MVLSVCITTYSLEKVIDETLNSVFSQKTNYEFEVLVGDDGSSDGTVERICAWEEKYPGRIKHFVMYRDPAAKYNSIIRASLNRVNLFRHAKGKYITFLDGDDLYADGEFYQKAIDVLEDPQNADCALCGGSTMMFWPNGVTRPLLMSPWKSGKLSREEYWRDHYTHAEAVIMRNGFNIPPALEKMFDDNLVTFAGLTQGDIFLLPNPVALYRQNAEGTNYLNKPYMERCLYQLSSVEIEIGMASELQNNILHRHRSDIATVNKYSREVTKERYSDVYEYVKALDLKSMLGLFRGVQKERATRKIRVVFLICNSHVWSALKTVFDACIADEKFEVVIMALPTVKYGSNNAIEIIPEGAENFFKDFPCQVINGFHYERKIFFDLHELQPDYVVYCRSHDGMLPPIYSSDSVSQYSKICTVPDSYQSTGSEKFAGGENAGERIKNSLEADYRKSTDL